MPNKKILAYISNPKLENALMLAVLAIAGFIIFGRCLDFGITYLDDYYLISQSKALISEPENIGKIFTSTIFPEQNSYYRPMLLISLLADFITGKGSYFSFHLTNLILHILTAFLLFIFLKEIAPRKIRTFLALLFLVSPLTISGAAWIPGRNDSILAIAVLLSFCSTASLAQTGKKSRVMFIFLSSLFALLTKENAVSLVIALPWLCFCFTEGTANSKKRILLTAFASAAAAVVWFFMRSAARPSFGIIDLETFFSSFVYIPHLLGKMMFPFFPAPIYELQDISGYYPLATLAAAITVYFFAKERKNASFIVFGFALFFLFGIPAFISEKAAEGNIYWLEHRYYVPAAGLYIAASQIILPDLNRKIKIAIKILFSGILIMSAAISYLYIPVFREKSSFWDTVAKQPAYHAKALTLAGDAYYDKWLIENKIEYAEKAVDRYAESEKLLSDMQIPEHISKDSLYNYGLASLAISDLKNARIACETLNRENHLEAAQSLLTLIKQKEAAIKTENESTNP